MLKTTFLVIALGSFLDLSESDGLGDTNNTTMNLDKFIELAQALKYGDACSWEVEAKRQEFTKTALSGTLEALTEMIKVFNENEYKMCSALELFVCDKETQKCVCGDAGKESLLGIDRSLFILEENNKCRWNADSYCLPGDLMEMPGLAVEMKCKTGINCKTGEGEVCSLSEVIKYISKKYSAEELLKGFEQILFSGEVCSCK